MAECSECGEKSMSFTCRYCGEKFCSEHRLPENHECEGLETGKKEEFSTSSSSNNEQQKWFDDKFSNKKEKKREKEFRKPNLLNESKRILKSNITLAIIAVTVFAFFLHTGAPEVQHTLELSPALTEASFAETNDAIDRYNQQVPEDQEIENLRNTFFEAPWGLLTVVLVHAGAFHLLANMVTFYFFGTAVEKTLGGMEMLKIYLISALAASIAYVIFRNALFQVYGGLNHVIPLAPAVGASGAVIAMFGVVAMLYPEAEVLLYFIIPMKIKTALNFFIGLEVVNLLALAAGIRLPFIGGFASSAHLAGLAVGLYYGRKIQQKHGRKTGVFNPLGY